MIVGAADRERLEAIAGDRNRPRKHVERTGIVLASADRGPAQRVVQSIGVSRPTVWRWQQRFVEGGVEGLLRDDHTRKPGKAPIAAAKAAQRHRHNEFTRFLNAVEREIPPEKPIHAVLENYATHKHPNVLAWLARYPRWTFHFTPTSASWLNAVKNFSSTTRQRIRRRVFHSIVDLQSAINAYLAEHMPIPNRSSGPNPPMPSSDKLDRIPIPSDCVYEY